MLENVLLRLKEEIAMDGNQGTSMTDVWVYVERFLVEEVKSSNNNSSNSFTTTIMPVVDSHYKTYFWPYFRHLPELSFFTKDQPLVTEGQQLKDVPAAEDKGNVGHEYHLIQDITQQDYDQVESKYGSRLYVVADEKLREAQLFIGIPIGQPWPTNLRYYLSTILQAREAGITQAELTRLWSTDPRISGHFVKKLQEKGAISRTMATINGTRTNLCVHVRFKNCDIPIVSAELKSGNTNMSGVVYTRTLLLDRLNVLLANTKDNMMCADEILVALGFDLSSPKTRKWFARTTDHLCQYGHIRKSKSHSNGVTWGQQCIQLAKSKSELESRLTQDGNDQMNNSIDKFGDLDPFVLKARNESTHSSKLLYGVTVEYQILRLIRTAENQGITHKDIGTALRCDNQRITTRALDQLYENKQNGNFSHGLERVLEFVGRNRRYRYYAHHTEPNTIDHYNQSNMEEIDYRALEPKATNCNKNFKKKDRHSSTTTGTRANNRSTNKKKSLANSHGAASPDQQFPCVTSTANLSSNTTSATKRTIVPTAESTQPNHQPLNNSSTSSTHAPIDAVFATSSSTISKDKPIQHINKYLEMRKQIVMALLEDKNIIERGIGLTKLFLAKQAELFGDNGNNNSHLIDGKTIWRSVMTLEKDGHLQICERHIPLLNGKTTTRQFLLKKDLDTNGPVMESYFELLTERRLLQPTMNNNGRTEMTNAQVELLRDQLTRIQNANPSAAAFDESTGPLELNNNDTSLEIGVKFGYVSCRMARAKLLHLYLLETLDSGSGVDRIERRIPTTVFIYNMTLGFFCKVFGVFGSTDQFKAYVQDESHYAVTLAELPNVIRGCIFPYMDQFRARLRVLLGYLIILGLVEKEGDTGPSPEHNLPALATAYTLTTKADIRNYRLAGHPILQEHSLLDMVGALMYWNNLEYLCTKTNLDDGESAVPLTNGHTHAKWIRSLYTQRNWHSSTVFTRAQKAALDKHVDLNNQSTPLNHTAWCRSIASDLNLSVKSVRGYYRKFELAMHRNLKRVQQTSPPLETLYGNKTTASESILKYKGGRISSPVIPRSIKVQEVARYKGLVNDENSAPWRKNSRTSPQAAPSQPKRKTWTAKEDDLLKLCYVILNSRKECGARFIWTPLDKLFHTVSRRQCIRRLTNIRDIPKHSEDIQNIRIRWHRYYNQGVANGSLVSWTKEKGYDCDITPYMTYYLDQYQLQLDHENDSPDICPHLPANGQLLQQYYDLRCITALNTHSCVFFEDNYHQKHSSTAIRRSLYSHSFTQRIHTTESYDHLPTQHLSKLETSKRIIKLLQDFFKMILFTPDELYDPFYAHAVIIKYPQALLDMALEQSQKEGVLVRTNMEHTAGRRVPKTSLVMSERFLQGINTRFPAHIWSSAHEYENYLATVTKTLLDPLKLHDGKMACILDLLSIGKVSISTLDFNDAVARSGSCYTTKHLYESTLNYTLSLEMVENPRSCPCEEHDNQQEIKLLPRDRLASVVQAYCDSSLDKTTSVLVQQIVDYLYSRLGVGATLLELKQNMVNEQGLAAFTDNLFLASVDIITNQTSPPVATVVGHDDPRLVLTSELQPWTIVPRLDPKADTENTSIQLHIPTISIPNSTISAPSDNNDKPNDPSQPTKGMETGRQTKRRRLDDNGRKEYQQQHDKVVIPRLWMDIYGHKIESIWRKCMDLVVEAILTRPGITFGHLRRILMNKLTAVEIKELLKVLIGWGIIRQLCVSGATSPSLRQTKSGRLFTSRCTLRTVSVSTIDSSVQTSYWLLPGYYNRLPFG